jgi:eukaryotic-like serine/threonine-protein kinase
MKFFCCLVFLFLMTMTCCKSKDTHTPVWQWRLESRCYADPVIDGNTVFIVSQAGEVRAGEITTGKLYWKRKLPGAILASPVVHSDYLFTATENGFIYALDKKSGKDLWQKHLDDTFQAPLSTSSNLLLVPSSTGTLRALALIDGETKWESAGHTKYNTRAVVSEAFILIGDWNHTFSCFKLDGTVNWQFQTGGIIAGDALIHRNRVFFSSRDNSLYGLEIPTGKFLWRFPARLPTQLNFIRDEIAFADNQGVVFLIQPESGSSSKKIFVKKPVSQLYSFSNRCIVVSQDAYEIDPEQGKISLLFSLPRPIFKMGYSDRIYVAIDDLYSVYGFRN